MRNFIAAVSLAAFANVLAHADESYAPPEANNTERALPDVVQSEPAQIEQTSPQVSGGEEAEPAESAAAGDGAQSGDDSAASEDAAAATDSESPADLDV
jgi:hypothetical protein